MDAKANVTKQFLEDNNYSKTQSDEKYYSKTQSDEKYSQRITYSTEEVDTGNKWIDGKTIYTRSKKFNYTIGQNKSCWDNVLTENNIDSLVDMKVVVNYQGTTNVARSVIYYYDSGDFLRLYLESNTVMCQGGSNYPKSNPAIITIFYTKAA